MDQYLEEVQRRLYIHSNHAPGGIRIDGIMRLRIRVPIVRKELRTPYSFSSFSPSKQLDIWDYIWNQTTLFEVMSLALYAHQGKILAGEKVEVIKNWVERINCWEHSDDLSKILANVIEANPDQLLPVYEQWNRSENPWKRRQSIVGLIEYAGKRKRFLPFEKLISFINPLLDDEDYYVQKGIGWTIREIYNAYPEKALDYISQNLGALNPNAYSSATEKIPKELKKQLNQRRKGLRKK